MEPAKINDLNRLRTYLKDRAERLIAEGKKQGLIIKIIETLRTQARQTWLHQQNKNNPALIGPHGAGLAFDAAPLQPDGSINWSDHDKFARMGAIGKSLGLTWGGNWPGVDMPHFQFTGGLSDAEIRAGKLPKFPTTAQPVPPIDKQFRVYGAKMLGNGLTEQYAKDKAVQLKAQGYEVYYITPEGKKVEVK